MEQKYKVEYSKEAKQDLSEIYSYIKYNLQEPNIAKNLISEIRESLNKLKNNPQIYPIIEDGFMKRIEIRKIIVKNYIIFYRVDSKNLSIQIVRIMYARRNWIELL